MTQPILRLKNFDYPELFKPQGLARLDEIFLDFLNSTSPLLHDQLLSYRTKPTPLTLEISQCLIECAKILEEFLADLFNIQEALAQSQVKTTSNNPLAIFKKYYILKRAKKELSKVNNLPSFNELNHWLNEQINNSPLKTKDKELAVALLGVEYLDQPDIHATHIENLVAWCARALTTPEGRQLTANWSSFLIPEKLDYDNLVPQPFPPERLRLRDGFALTDPRMNAREVQDQVNYCIYCHDHSGDFCSKGFPVKKGDPTQGFKKNPLDITLTGCPLEEKISEMNLLKHEGATIASLAMVMIDNPMCPATGHRICNDCMKACIYQKQDPVNIPQIETRVLTDVLALPWGVEIYDLLTRWNPLRPKQWVMKPYNGLKVMIAGMGPAGFTLAHHLLLEGFAVVGFDGLKIEPLPRQLVENPIYRYADLQEALDERLMAGFGGVAEYGITVRWDKNFLKLIYLSLLRRPTFQVFGSVRFGGTIKVEDAWEMGFDHFVVAVGAGLPKALPIPHSLAPGMRQANDFLMALQLGNAAKTSSLTNLQVRLPALVIGGGLTGVDAATELQAYYIAQVEKTLSRYETLVATLGEDAVLAPLDAAAKDILAEFLLHGKMVREERKNAEENKVPPNFIKLIHAWGGVSIVYRRRMNQSPAYINNHEELKKALEEGIFYLEELEPKAAVLDSHGHIKEFICQKRESLEEISLAARTILVATGTQPNTAYEFEHRGTFNRINLQYQHYEDKAGELVAAHGVAHCKDPNFGPFTSYQAHDKRVSLIGDTHPVFHGSVVRAIASGFYTYPKIMKSLQSKIKGAADLNEYQQFANHMRHAFSMRVHSTKRIADNVLELTIKAPMAAKHFKPGEFYRLQNFESLAPQVNNTLLQMEPLALVAAEADVQAGNLTFIVHETNAASKLCAVLKPDEPVALMGPTGVRAKIPAQHETVLIIGNESSFAFVRSYGPELRAAGNKVLFIGMFDSAKAVHGKEKLEKATDSIVWLTTEGELVKVARATDYAYNNTDIIEALLNYKGHIKLADVDRAYLVGTPDLLRTFQSARKTTLKNIFLKDPKVLGAVYGNMQCMLKGVCAQCLQWQLDPETGLRTKAVFACSWQDQPLEIIDIDHIHARAQQNHLQEVLSNLWVDLLFTKFKVNNMQKTH